MNQSTSIPLLKENEQQLIGLRGRLEGMFRSLSLIHDVTVVCGAASESVNSDSDAEVSHVLRRCGTNELDTQMKELTSIIEQLGGRTEFSDHEDDDQEMQLEASDEQGYPRAKQVLQALIPGVDPETGNELPKDTVLNRVDVVRTLLSSVAAIEQVTAREARRAQLPSGVGQHWTGDEEQRLKCGWRSKAARFWR